MRTWNPLTGSVSTGFLHEQIKPMWLRRRVYGLSVDESSTKDDLYIRVEKTRVEKILMARNLLIQVPNHLQEVKIGRCRGGEPLINFQNWKELSVDAYLSRVV